MLTQRIAQGWGESVLPGTNLIEHPDLKLLQRRQGELPEGLGFPGLIKLPDSPNQQRMTVGAVGIAEAGLRATVRAHLDALARKPKPRDAGHAESPAGAYATRPEVRDFAAQLAERRQLPVEWVLAQLAQARLQPAAQRLMMPPPAGTAKNWAAYRDRFVEPQRITAGARFWQDNAAWLQRAEAQYGVPPEIVVGIVGVETFYGRVTGNFRVLDVLSTLAFDFPSGRSDRSAFFRDELEQFLLLSRREGVEDRKSVV